MCDRKYSVLFAEDDLSTHPELTLLIEVEGFAVDTATTGQGAYQLLERNVYDALILDNMMAPGGEDGSEWSRKETQAGLNTGLKVLRKMAESGRTCPVWVVTALPDTEVEAAEKNFPFVIEYIRKDFSLTELARKIRSYLEKQHVNP